MNKPVDIGLSILDLNKTVIYEVWYDYIKPKDGEKQDFIVWIQTASYEIQMILTNTFHKMLKQDLTLQIKKQIIRRLYKKIKK